MLKEKARHNAEDITKQSDILFGMFCTCKNHFLNEKLLRVQLFCRRLTANNGWLLVSP